MAIKRPKSGTIDDATIEWKRVSIDKVTTMEGDPPTPVARICVTIIVEDSAGKQHHHRGLFSDLGSADDRLGSINLLDDALAKLIAAKFEDS